MTKELLFEIKSPSRDSLKVYGFRFTPLKKIKNFKKIAIVAALNGNELNQLYLASKLVNFLKEKSSQNNDFINSEILIIPSVNHFALNMGERFWPLDKTDLNVMFPGYDKGETTQRIAGKLFEKIKDFDYGIIFEDRKDKAASLPHVKVYNSGFEDLKSAKLFGFSFIYHKELAPIDTGSLHYNLEVWNTKTFSIVYGDKRDIKQSDFYIALDGVIRFLSKIGAIKHKTFDGYNSNIITKNSIRVIKAHNGGIFEPDVNPGYSVKKHQILGKISDPLDGSIKEILQAEEDGVITTIYSYPLIFQNSVCFRIATI